MPNKKDSNGSSMRYDPYNLPIKAVKAKGKTKVDTNNLSKGTKRIADNNLGSLSWSQMLKDGSMTEKEAASQIAYHRKKGDTNGVMQLKAALAKHKKDKSKPKMKKGGVVKPKMKK